MHKSLNEFKFLPVVNLNVYMTCKTPSVFVGGHIECILLSKQSS